MQERLSINYALEWIAAGLTAIAGVTVIYTFIVGQHYIIPTITLVNMIILGNVAYYGLRNQQWARTVLFWAAIVVSAHAFFALFWAKAPRELLGPAFVPTYVGLFVLFSVLAWVYRREAFAASKN